MSPVSPDPQPLGRAACAFVLVACLLLAACAGPRAFSEGRDLLAAGKTEQGLARLEKAVALEPRNAEYRIALASTRASVLNRMIAAGEAARREGRLSDAEKAYRQALGFDAESPMARQGLEALTMERRHRLVVADAEGLYKQGKPDDLAEAQERLRAVLTENPNQRDARHLQARIEEARSKVRRPEVKLAATFRKPISLEFRDTPLKSVMEVLAKASGLNFYYDNDIRPDLKATIFARDTSVEDALRLLLATNQLEHKVLSENSILIYPSTPQKLKDYQTLAVRSFYLVNADVKAVSNSIKTIVKTKDLVVDERLGIIIVRDTPEAIRMAERIVALQDLSDPEVMLDVEVLEIKRSRLMELGIQWPSQMTLAPLQIAGAPLTLFDLRHLDRTSLQVGIDPMTIKARREDQDSNILANPRIRVRNKEKAKIQIGDRVPVITTTSTTISVSESVNYVDVGLKLEVEPLIYLDEEVSIKVNLEVSNLVREILSKSGTLSYQIGTRGANTVLRLRDGETQILAGLISDEDRTSGNRVPGLGHLPVAGRLFGSQKDDTQRSEILLSITPRIVRSIRRPDMLAAEFESGTEANVGAASLMLSAARSDGEPAAGRALGGGADRAPSESAAALAGSAGAVVSRDVAFGWQAPAQVRVGEQFSAVLRLSSSSALNGMPVLLDFDPQVLQVVDVREGEYFRQGGARTSFSHRIEPAQGKVFAASVRQSGHGHEGGVNGDGALVTVVFKALKAGGAARLALLSATPEPAQSTALPLPLRQTVQVLP